MVRGRSPQHLGTGYGICHVDSAVQIERFPRFRAGAGALFRQCHRRRTLCRREIRDFSGAPGGRFNQKLYGRPDDPKPLGELFSVADEHGGKLPNRVVFYCDELGTMPPFDILPLFSAGRSRKLTLVPIIQSLAQLEKNYGKEGAEIIADNCQDTIFGGFAPNSQTAETLSKALGSRTVLTGSVSKGKDNTSRSLQMAERALLSPDELKNLPKGNFIVMKTGTHPMRTKLQLYFKWGISFEEPYQVPERAQREVYYAGKEELLMNIKKSLYSQPQPITASKPDGYMSSYGDK